ncbi:MAG: kelch repeat-containing protein [bacterium]|nr:kelch repeat-containing protein [bacterium]
MNRSLPLLLIAFVIGACLFSCTKRQPEEIDNAPNSPFNPYPPDSATNIDHTTLDVTLRWTATDPNSGDVMTYEVYLDTLDPPEAKIVSGLSSPSYFMTGLSYNTTYYWKLYVTDDKGVTTSGPVWRFATLPHANAAPTVPGYVSPLDGTTNVYPTLDLRWNCNDPDGISDTVSYIIYVGGTSSPPAKGSTSDTSFEACCLDYSTDYYWKVAASDNHGAIATGPLSAFTTRTSPWFIKASMPTARYNFCTAAVNGKIYTIGGQQASGRVLAVVEEYDPASDVWIGRTPMPTARTQAAAAVWNGSIYVFGGRSEDYVYNIIEVFDPVSNVWSVKDTMNKHRFGLGAGTVNNKIYIFGGATAIGEVYEYYTKSVLEYDPLTGRWNPKPKRDMVGVRSSFFTTILGNQIYVIGGRTVGTLGSPSVPLNTVHAFEPSTNRWLRKPYLLKARSDGAAAVANGCVYVMGGTTGTIIRRVEMLNPALNAWIYKGDMLNSRMGLGAAENNGYIYAIGGSNPYVISWVEEYHPLSDIKR